MEHMFRDVVFHHTNVPLEPALISAYLSISSNKVSFDDKKEKKHGRHDEQKPGIGAALKSRVKDIKIREYTQCMIYQ